MVGSGFVITNKCISAVHCNICVYDAISHSVCTLFDGFIESHRGPATELSFPVKYDL